MKILNIFSLISLCWFVPTHPEIGCMDNSYHTQQAYDHKTYHYVACDCPCKQYKHYYYKGYRCTKCEHAHDPKLVEFVRKSYNATAENYPTINMRLFSPVKRHRLKNQSTARNSSKPTLLR